MALMMMLILSIFMSLYLSSNVGITSTLKKYWGEKGVERWSDLLLKVYFVSICLSVTILALYRQFELSNIFDLVAIVSIILNGILWIKNLRTRDKWSAAELIRDRDWLNGFLIDIPRIYIFCYTIVKLFLLGHSLGNVV